MSYLLERLGLSLLLTLALECPMAYILGKRKLDLALAALVNILTNPIVVLSFTLLTAYTSIHPWLLTGLLEGFAVVTEGICFWKCGKHFPRPFLFSLGVNAFSFLIGEGINAVIPYIS